MEPSFLNVSPRPGLDPYCPDGINSIHSSSQNFLSLSLTLMTSLQGLRAFSSFAFYNFIYFFVITPDFLKYTYLVFVNPWQSGTVGCHGRFFLGLPRYAESTRTYMYSTVRRMVSIILSIILSRS